MLYTDIEVNCRKLPAKNMNSGWRIIIVHQRTNSLFLCEKVPEGD